MEPQGYKIIFEGKVAAGVDVDTAKGNLQRLFKTNDTTIERLFSGKRVIIKRDVPPASIDKYLKALTKAGVEFRTDPAIQSVPKTIDFVVGSDVSQVSDDMPRPDADMVQPVEDVPNTDDDNTDLTNVDLTVQSTTQFDAGATGPEVRASDRLDPINDLPAAQSGSLPNNESSAGVKPPIKSDAAEPEELALVEKAEPASEASANKPADNPSEPADNPYAPPTQDPTVNKQVFCRSCGSQIYESDVICPQCGAKQLVGKPKSKVVAALLAIFLGFIGAHRFYLGQWLGILYIFFGFIAWLVAIIEGVVFLLTPSESWNRKYGNVVTSGGAAMAIVAVIVFVMITGILAAIAIPAYVDYTHRAAVASAEAELEPTLQAIEDFAGREGYLPNSNDEAGLPAKISTDHIKSAVISTNGALLVVLDGKSGSPVAEQTMLWVPQINGQAVSWDCSGGTLPAKLRTSTCREGQYSGQQSIATTRWIAADDGASKILLPASWQKMPELTEVAGIEYGNPYREQYAIVISENKADFGDDIDLFAYNDIIIEQNFRASVDNLNVKLLGEIDVNGMQGVKYELRGRVDNINVVYLHIALEGRDHYHQVLFWTLPSKWRGSRKVFETALKKFTECPGGCGLN